MEEQKCIACGMPITQETYCSCDHSRCYHCCDCDDDCSCGCGNK
ncbi:MAG: hypothetical protein ABIF17_00485 [Patescibacteria group bacterium]